MSKKLCVQNYIEPKLIRSYTKLTYWIETLTCPIPCYYTLCRKKRRIYKIMWNRPPWKMKSFLVILFTILYISGKRDNIGIHTYILQSSSIRGRPLKIFYISSSPPIAYCVYIFLPNSVLLMLILEFNFISLFAIHFQCNGRTEYKDRREWKKNFLILSFLFSFTMERFMKLEKKVTVRLMAKKSFHKNWLRWNYSK